MMKRLSYAAGAAVLATMLGCSGASIRTFSQPPTGQRQYGKVKKVAVLPFDSVVEGAQAPKIAGDLFVQDLLHEGTFDAVEEPRYVGELMKKLKLRNTEGLDREIVRKMGEEVQAQALVLGNLLMYGQEENSEIVEFALQVDMVDVDTGDILWSGRTYAHSSTTWGEVLGVNHGPSANDVATRGVHALVKRLDREFRKAREAEVERMLEAAQAQPVAEESGAASATPAGEKVVPQEKTEEILLNVKPK